MSQWAHVPHDFNFLEVRARLQQVVIRCLSADPHSYDSHSNSPLSQFCTVYPVPELWYVGLSASILTAIYLGGSIVVLRRCHSYMVLQQLYEQRWKAAVRSREIKNLNAYTPIVYPLSPQLFPCSDRFRHRSLGNIVTDAHEMFKSKQRLATHLFT